MKKSFSIFVLLGLIVTFATCASGANANEQYQTEMSLLFGRQESSNDFRVTSVGLSAEVFFDDVKTAKHPYGEAAFLERIGSIFVGTMAFDVKSTAVQGDGTMLAAGVNIVNPGSPLALQFFYSTSDFDYDPPAIATFEADSYGISIGGYIKENLLVSFDYMRTETDFSAPGYLSMNEETQDFAVFTKYVHPLSQSKAVNIEASVGQTKSDDQTETLTNTNIAINADYYFNRRLSAGAGIEKSSGDNDSDEGTNFLARARYFITPWFSVQASHERFNNSNEGQESDRSFDVTVVLRF